MFALLYMVGWMALVAAVSLAAERLPGRVGLFVGPALVLLIGGSWVLAGVGTPFTFAKLVSVAGALCLTVWACEDWPGSRSRWLVWALITTLAVNILEAVIAESLTAFSMNLVAGVLLLPGIPGPAGWRVTAREQRGLSMEVDLGWLWIAAYTVWNFAFVYGTAAPGHPLGEGALLALLHLVVPLLLTRGRAERWMQSRMLALLFCFLSTIGTAASPVDGTHLHRSWIASSLGLLALVLASAAVVQRWLPRAEGLLRGLLAVGVGSWAVGAGLLGWADVYLRDTPSFVSRPVTVPWPGSSPEAAVERGRALYHGRYGCVGCHGENLEGGGSPTGAYPYIWAVGPNLSPGGVVGDYSPADWDALVRHGVRPDGRAALMPVLELYRMSDQELSDLIAFIRSVPARPELQRPSSVLLPGALAMAVGALLPSAREIDPDFVPRSTPPESAVELGAHIAQSCAICHRDGMEGGPVAVGAPDWPAASNLTPHADGLATWSEADFTTLLREGRRPDGSSVSDVMPWRNLGGMPDEDLHALWLYLRSLPARPTGR